MTQSGGRGQSPARFLSRLARETSLSQRAIIRQAREAGFRFGNDLARGLINAARGRELSQPQGQSLFRLSLRLNVSGDPNAIGNLVGDATAQALQEYLRNAMLRISYRVSAEVGFIWQSGSTDDQETRVAVDRQVTIGGDQIGSFNENIDAFANTHNDTLIQLASDVLGFDSQYGEFIFTSAPEIGVTSASLIS